MLLSEIKSRAILCLTDHVTSALSCESAGRLGLKGAQKQDMTREVCQQRLEVSSSCTRVLIAAINWPGDCSLPRHFCGR